VNPALVPNLNPLEYDLGLYTNDRKLKPAGQALKNLVAEFDRTPPKPQPRPAAIVVPDADPTRGNDRFFALADAGKRVGFVLQSRAGDANHLKQRGITELIRL
jgi:hypothetical protein